MAALGIAVLSGSAQESRETGFDHAYQAYADLLSEHSVGIRVDYAKLASHSAALADVVRQFGAVSESELRGWPRARQLAYWINAYNLFTLQVIVDHYPIRGSWLSVHPRNSIQQIDGVWD